MKRLLRLFMLILCLLLGNIFRLGVPAVVVGLLLAYGVSGNWLEHFPEKVGLHLLLFVAAGVGLSLLIAAAVVVRSWPVANENPVKYIKSE